MCVSRYVHNPNLICFYSIITKNTASWSRPSETQTHGSSCSHEIPSEIQFRITLEVSKCEANLRALYHD